MTRDGVLVVSHDRSLNPDHTRGPDGAFLAAQGPAIRSLTLAEVQRYDIGRLKPGTRYAASLPDQQPVDDTRIPTLAEAFELARRVGADHVRFNYRDQGDADLGERDPRPGNFCGGGGCGFNFCN